MNQHGRTHLPAYSRMVPLLAAGILCSSLEAGCRNDDDSCSRNPPLTYDNFGQGFMEKNCTGCHSSLLPEDERNGAPLGIDFDTYAGVIQWVDRIEARATGDDPTMPPGGGPSDEDRLRLSEWLTCQVYPDAEALAAEEGS